MKLIVAVWPTMISALPDETSQIGRLRSGAVTSSGSAVVPCLPRGAAQQYGPGDRTDAAGGGQRSERPAEADGGGERRQDECRDEAAEGHVRLADAEREPSLEGSNHCITARPLAALTLALSAPAAARRSDELARSRRASPTPASARPEAPSPRGRTMRSPTRSASSPQGSSVGVIPIVNAASTIPVSAIVSWNSARSSGASTATLNIAAETQAWAAVPTPSTTHR